MAATSKLLSRPFTSVTVVTGTSTFPFLKPTGEMRRGMEAKFKNSLSYLHAGFGERMMDGSVKTFS